MSSQFDGDGPEPAGPGLTRRSMLVRAGGAAVAASSLASVLAACGGSSSSGGTSTGSGSGRAGIGGIPVASKEHPVRLPIYPGNSAIASGLKPEKGPLVVFDWGDYISPDVLKSFESKYGVQTNLTTFSSFQEALGKITSGAIQADVWVPVVERIPQLVAGRLIQPLNRSYVPNLDGVLPALANPYYDQGSQYTAPNYIWTTGIQWRGDLLPNLDPSRLANPWDVFWTTPAANGKIGLQNAEVFDPISLGLLRNGVRDFPNVTKAQLNAAVAQLDRLTKRGAKFHYTAFQPQANGTEILSQAWCGDAFVTPGYLPKGTPSSVVKYWFPTDGSGSVNSDFWCIPKNSRHPVLGHLFINHLLDTESAVMNYKSVGYQQPLNGLTSELLKQRKVGDAALLDMVYVTPEMATNGLPNPTPTREQLAWYESAFQSLSSGAS